MDRRDLKCNEVYEFKKTPENYSGGFLKNQNQVMVYLSQALKKMCSLRITGLEPARSPTRT